MSRLSVPAPAPIARLLPASPQKNEHTNRDISIQFVHSPSGPCALETKDAKQVTLAKSPYRAQTTYSPVQGASQNHPASSPPIFIRRNGLVGSGLPAPAPKRELLLQSYVSWVCVREVRKSFCRCSRSLPLRSSGSHRI